MKEKPIFEKENVLVTGGAGFIGSHLCGELIKHSKVICVDNFITGREENIDFLLQKQDFEFIRHDISEPLDLEKYPELEKFKVKFQGIQKVYHLACPTSPKEYNKIPIETLLTNSHGTKNTLDIAKKHSAKFLFLSSSAVYGEPLEDAPFREDYWGFIDPTGPRSCYNEGKRFAESMIMNYAKAYNMEVKIFRLFNTFGPKMRMDDGRMIPDFIVSALAGKDIEINGGESAESTYCYIADVIEAVQKAMRSSFSGIVNVGNPKKEKIAEIAKEIIRITESSSKLIFKDPLPYTTKQGVPDISLAKEKLGWFPVVTMIKGLEQTIEQMKGRSKIMNIKDVINK